MGIWVVGLGGVWWLCWWGLPSAKVRDVPGSHGPYISETVLRGGGGLNVGWNWADRRMYRSSISLMIYTSCRRSY